MSIRLKAWATLCFCAAVSLGLLQWSFHDHLRVSRWTTSGPSTIYGLTNPDIVLRTPGRSLVDQTEDAFVPIQMVVPRSTEGYFTIVIQCDDNIVGNTILCPPTYLVHFRGSIAHSIPPVSQIYHHDDKLGRTEIECYLSAAGTYEVWVWPDRDERGACPANPTSGPLGTVKGSGETLLVVTQGEEVDHLRSCTVDDYQGEMPGRWVSVGHIRQEYRKLLPYPSTKAGMPSFVYLPYQCKRNPLSYAAVQASPIKHVAYLGDSIFRTSFCNHLYPILHNGTIGQDCAYSGDIKGYHLSDKEFKIDDTTYSLRFISNHPADMGPAFATLSDEVSHVLINIGMWFGDSKEGDYINAVTTILNLLWHRFGDKPHYTWVDTYSLSPAVMCYETMRRVLMRRHGQWAKIALDDWHDRHPSVKLNQIKSFPIVDSRPESTSDGRHWVSEGGLPSLLARPLVGAADDAVMEAVYDYWLLSTR